MGHDGEVRILPLWQKMIERVRFAHLATGGTKCKSVSPERVEDRALCRVFRRMGVEADKCSLTVFDLGPDGNFRRRSSAVNVTLDTFRPLLRASSEVGSVHATLSFRNNFIDKFDAIEIWRR
ncbi:hypothetical protein AS026_28610 [Rhizobium altiplani]|uniref:Uncharacterized protein n=1 Tax=Rhizobium altiplani TaxID=1864509 RepID=A0A109K288_9HYPH|nr:hypothetical protein AS026_28610 [Rhizobium altiplani]